MSAPDFLTILETIVAADPAAPGFDGRLAIGLYSPTDVQWLLITATKAKVSLVRIDDLGSSDGFDCVWLVPRGPEVMPDPKSRTFVEGDRTLLVRFDTRYLQTRSHLGFQFQRITNIRDAAKKKVRAFR